MSQENHIIGRQIFEIEVDSKSDARFVHENLSLLFHSHLQGVIESALNSLGMYGDTLFFERIELDIGQLSKKDFHQQTLLRVKQELVRALQAASAGLKPEGLQTPASLIETVEYFLLKGRMPWWKSAKHAGTPDQLLQQLMQYSPDELRRMLVRLIGLHRVADRIRLQVGNETLAALGQMVAREMTDEVQLAGELKDWFRKYRLPEQPNTFDPRREINFLLLYAGLTRMSASPAPNYLFTLFVQHFSVLLKSTEATVVRSLLIPLKNKATSTAKGTQLLKSIRAMAETGGLPLEKTGHSVPSTGADPQSGLPGQIQALLFFLERGYLPANAYFLTTESLQAAWMNLSEPTGAPEWITRLSELMEKPGVIERLLTQFTPAFQQRILEWLTGRRDWGPLFDLADRIETALRNAKLTDSWGFLLLEMTRIFGERPNPEQAKNQLLEALSGWLQEQSLAFYPDFKSILEGTEPETSRDNPSDHTPPAGKPAVNPPTPEVLETFFEKWIANPSEGLDSAVSFEASVQTLADRGDEVVFHKILQKIRQSPNAETILRSFSGGFIRLLAQKAGGSDWDDAKNAMEDLKMVFPKTGVGVLSLPEFDRVMVVAALQYLIQKKAAFDTWAYWRLAVEQLSSQTGQTQAQLGAAFRQGIRQFMVPASFKTRLPQQILAAEIRQEVEREATLNEKALLHFLQYGVWPKGELLPTPAQKERLFLRWLRADPVAVRQAFVRLAGKTNLAQRATAYFSAKAVDELILLLAASKETEWRQLLRDLDLLPELQTDREGAKIKPREIREYLLQAMFRDLAGGEPTFAKASADERGKRAVPQTDQLTIAPDPVQILKHVFSQWSRDAGKTLRQLIAEIEPLADKKTFSRDFKAIVAAVKAWISPEDVKTIQVLLEAERAAFEALKPQASARQTAAESLAFYLESRQTPWWDPGFHPEKRLTDLLSKYPGVLSKELAEPLSRPGVLSGWAPKLSDTARRRMLETVSGDYAGYLFAFFEAVEALYKTRDIRNKTTLWLVWETAIAAFFAPPKKTARALTTILAQTIAREENLTVSHVCEKLKIPVDQRVQKRDIRFYRLSEILTELSGKSSKTGVPEKIGDTPDKPAQGQTPAPGAEEDRLFTEQEAAPAGEKKAKPSEKTGRQPGDPSSGPEIQTYATSVKAHLAAFQHFLFYGSLKPPYARFKKQELEQYQVQLIEAHPRMYAEFIRRILARKTAAVRLVAVFSPGLARRIAHLLLSAHLPLIYEFWKTIGELTGRPQTAYSSAYFEQLLHYAGITTSFDPGAWLEHLAVHLAERENMPAEIWLKNLQKQWPADVRTEFRNAVEEALDRIARRRKKREPETQIRKDRRPAGPVLEDALYIHNAGLVILAPFLPRYFDALEMVKNQAFVSEEAAARGVHLLQYLASGLTETEEHLLVFNKILCGLPLETPVPLSIEPTEKELATSGQLLNSVLQNWEKMKNSPVENLRGTFFIREGRLLENEQSWQLKVESKSFDILLEFLPWTYSMVKLPWMSKRIDVEWKTNN